MSEELEKVIAEYRATAEKEIAEERLVAGKPRGPREEVEKPVFEIPDLTHPARPFFAKRVEKDEIDTAYVTSVRVMRFGIPSFLGTSRTVGGAVYLSGMDMGVSLVNQGIVKDFATLREVLINLKIGIPDCIKEEVIGEEKRLQLRVYECISCSGLPNIGERVCQFEGGIIAGVLKEFTKLRTRATEVRCWASGYSFCEFDVRIALHSR